MQEPQVENLRDDPEVLETLRHYIEVSWRIFEKRERKLAAEKEATLLEIETGASVEEQHI